tara:strand:+ start:333 stop:1067 length:735 start_codon:yes stop_codon:yes gene_type:complete
MNLFGLEGVGFIISLAMTLLISGAIMFYSLRRFKVLENSVVEQGKILQSFIIRQQTQLNDSSNMASQIALESAKQQTQDRAVKDKIEVSDDEDEYDSQSNSDSETSSVEELKITDSSDKEITLTTQEFENIDLVPTNNTLDLEDSVKMITVGDMTAILSVEDTLNNDDHDSDSDSESEGILEITEEVEEKNDQNENDENEQKDKKLKQMKVQELRDFALKELSEPPENVKNMKKDQLIKLLSEK